jgi:hypothetical protein
VRARASLAPERMAGFNSCPIFKVLSITDRYPVNMNITVAKKKKKVQKNFIFSILSSMELWIPCHYFQENDSEILLLTKPASPVRRISFLLGIQ